MESTENLETRPVHVLRHRFEMSARLSEKVIEILALDSDRFRVLATKRVAVEGSDYYSSKLDTQLTELTDSFRRHDTPIALNGKMSIKTREHNQIGIAIQVAKQLSFDVLLSRLEKLPHHDTNKFKGHYLTFSVASNTLLRSREGQAEAIQRFNDEVTTPQLAKLYSVAPLDITGYDSVMALPPRPEQQLWQDAS